MGKRSNVTNIEKYRKTAKPQKDANKKLVGARVKNARSKKRSSRLKTGASIFFIVSIFMLMSRYSTISKLNYEEHSLSRELEDTINRKKELYYELEMNTNSAKIEKEAREQLGMDYPKDEQIVYIDVH